GFWEDTRKKQAWFRENNKPIDFFPNVPVIDWCFRIYREMTWHNDPHPFGETPTLVLVGSEDAETPQVARDIYKRYVASSGPNSHYVEVSGAGHDVINVLKPKTEQGVQAYGAIYSFLSEILRNKAARP